MQGLRVRRVSVAGCKIDAVNQSQLQPVIDEVSEFILDHSLMLVEYEDPFILVFHSFYWEFPDLGHFRQSKLGLPYQSVVASLRENKEPDIELLKHIIFAEFFLHYLELLPNGSRSVVHHFTLVDKKLIRLSFP